MWSVYENGVEHRVGYTQPVAGFPSFALRGFALPDCAQALRGSYGYKQKSISTDSLFVTLPKLSVLQTFHISCCPLRGSLDPTYHSFAEVIAPHHSNS